MADEVGNDVSTDTLWRGSMMANAARDPYWQAAVRAEVLSHPDLQAVIEDKCATCHMPMARFEADVQGAESRLLDGGFGDPAHPLHTLALDGVSCALCHQIRDSDFGLAGSFSGGFDIDTERPAGQRDLFGPHPVAPGQGQIMQASSGFAPVESLHVEQAEICATCHTLYTPYVDASGQIAGEFPEQMAYHEWQASSFGSAVTCQGCHMPQASGALPLSVTGGPPRSPIHQHFFVGGNAYMLDILARFGQEMAVTSSSQHLQAKQDQIVEQMQKRTASLSIDETIIDGSRLTASVKVASMVGHKFPTGFPSRRAWIHLVVRDAAGQVVFESGGASAGGAIAGNDNDTDPTAYELHYEVIDSPEQVQIYEAIMADTEGEVTTTLLRGAGYLKDNRLLPAGFDKSAAGDDIAVHGRAKDDSDFGGGSDQIQYLIELGDAQGPLEVTAELLYHSIGYRWAENLRGYEAAEPDRFLAYYDAVSNQPLVVAAATQTTGE
jgi:hypothetical protein